MHVLRLYIVHKHLQRSYLLINFKFFARRLATCTTKGNNDV